MYPANTAMSALVAINTTIIAPRNPKIKLSLTPSNISRRLAVLYSFTIFFIFIFFCLKKFGFVSLFSIYFLNSQIKPPDVFVLPLKLLFIPLYPTPLSFDAILPLIHSLINSPFSENCKIGFDFA